MSPLGNERRLSSWALAALPALAATAIIPGLLLWDANVTHSVLMPILLVLLTLAGKQLLSQYEKRLRRFSLVFGFLLVLCQLAGWRLDNTGTLGGGLAPLRMLIAAGACAPAAGLLFAALARFCCCQPITSANAVGSFSPKRTFWIALALIMLCWLPYYLAYFPGMFNYDSAGEASQFLSGVYDGAFPPFHTLLLAGFYRLGSIVDSPNAGIALYTAIQSVTLAAAMAAAVAYLRELGCGRAFCWMMTAAFALLPFFPLLAMSTTKDVFFSAGLLTLFITLHRVWKTPDLLRKRSYLLRIALIAALICLLRTNGVAAVGAALIGGFFISRNARKRLIISLLCGLVLFGGAQYAMNQAMKPAPQGIREVLSVPLAQVARVYAQAQERGAALPEESEILAFIPDADRYQRHIADGIKRHTTVGLVNMGSFLNLYGRLASRYPADFADAWAYLTKGYWHLDDVTHLDIYAERGKHGYMETANQDGYGVSRASLWPALESVTDRLYVENEYKQIPILASLIEPALWCWLAGAALWIAVYQKNKAAIACGVMLAALYLTLVFGACAYMRYAFPLAVCAFPMLGFCLAERTRFPRKKGDDLP